MIMNILDYMEKSGGAKRYLRLLKAEERANSALMKLPKGRPSESSHRAVMKVSRLGEALSRAQQNYHNRVGGSALKRADKVSESGSIKDRPLRTLKALAVDSPVALANIVAYQKRVGRSPMQILKAGPNPNSVALARDAIKLRKPRK